MVVLESERTPKEGIHIEHHIWVAQMSLVVLNGFLFMIMINLSSDLIGVGFDLFIPFFTPDASDLKLNSNYQWSPLSLVVRIVRPTYYNFHIDLIFNLFFNEYYHFLSPWVLGYYYATKNYIIIFEFSPSALCSNTSTFLTHCWTAALCSLIRTIVFSYNYRI